MITQEEYDKMKDSVIGSLRDMFPQFEPYEIDNLYDTIALVANLQIRIALQALVSKDSINP
jgi:hypothetical protein